MPAGSLGLLSTRSPDSVSAVMSAISAAWSPPRATDTATTMRPLAAETSEIPAIGPDVAQTDSESRPVWAVGSPTPPIRSSNPVSPVINAAPMPAAAMGREGDMSGLPGGRYTIGYPLNESAARGSPGGWISPASAGLLHGVFLLVVWVGGELLHLLH